MVRISRDGDTGDSKNSTDDGSKQRPRLGDASSSTGAVGKGSFAG